MFKNAKLSTKIALGFSIPIVIAALLGFIGWNSLRRVAAKVDTVDDANWMINLSLQGCQAEKNFILSKNKEYESKGVELSDKFATRAKDLNAKLRVLEYKQMVNKASARMNEWITAFHNYVKLEDDKVAADAEMVKSAQAAIKEIEDMRADQEKKLLDEIGKQKTAQEIVNIVTKTLDTNHLKIWMHECRSNKKNYIFSDDKKSADSVKKTIGEMIALCEGMKTQIKDVKNKERADEIVVAVSDYLSAFEKFVATVELQKVEEQKMIEATRDLQNNANALRVGQKAKVKIIMTSSSMVMIALSVVTIIVGSLMAVIITLGIGGPLSLAIEALTEGAEQVSSASEQVSCASQTIAEGASEQASSLEETSSSLEEMTSMTNQNADNAKQANSLANEAAGAAMNGKEAMERLTNAIQDIKTSSDETAKIIKVIDEIAFQTNLLALNAAVEAARAGEAGKGFAVVAEEVRNLALRSSEAAKQTSSLIEESQGNSDKGVRATEDLFAVLKEVVSSIDKVSGLIGEVSAASEEQARGIRQINNAIAQINQVTQENASGAEESASASEELSSQARDVQDAVDRLVALVEGSNSRGKSTDTENRRSSLKYHKYGEKHVSGHNFTHRAAFGGNGNKDVNTEKLNNRKSRSVAEMVKVKANNPEEVIPLEEEDF